MGVPGQEIRILVWLERPIQFHLHPLGTRDENTGTNPRCFVQGLAKKTPKTRYFLKFIN